MGDNVKRFQSLTKYLSLLENDPIGTWVNPNKDKAPDAPRELPYVRYTEMVIHFVEDVYAFSANNRDFGLNNYIGILKKNGLKWGSVPMSNSDVSVLDAQCVMALLLGAVNAERFSDGALASHFKRGNIRRWLTRLKEFDDAQG